MAVSHVAILEGYHGPPKRKKRFAGYRKRTRRGDPIREAFAACHRRLRIYTEDGARNLKVLHACMASHLKSRRRRKGRR